jgi:anti-sigma factor RsiW
MNCNESRQFLEADADGELDLIRHLELEAHLRTCPQCAALADAARARRKALREKLPRFSAPPELVTRIRASLAGAGAPLPAARKPVAPVWPIWNVMGLAASVALAAIGGYAWGNSHARSHALLSEAVSDHVRSLQASHLMDVVSTDQHTVKPWFIGKLDFSPPVVDLADAGFPLAGGRLEHLDGRSAAALVFYRRQHAINVFVWPAGGGSVAAGMDRENGFNARTWSQADLNFAAVSEIPADELERFVAAYRSRTR